MIQAYTRIDKLPKLVYFYFLGNSDYHLSFKFLAVMNFVSYQGEKDSGLAWKKPLGFNGFEIKKTDNKTPIIFFL